MKVKNLFLLFLVGMFCSYVANAALDSTAEGCSKTFIYCGTYSFYTDAETGKQFTVFVSEGGEFIEKWDGHIKLKIDGTVNTTDNTNWAAVRFLTESQIWLCSNFPGIVRIKNLNGDILDSADIQPEKVVGDILVFKTPFDQIEILDIWGNVYWKVGNFTRDVPTVVSPVFCKPEFQYVQGEDQLYVTVEQTCYVTTEQRYSGTIYDLQTGDIVLSNIKISSGENTVNIPLSNGCYDLVWYKTGSATTTHSAGISGGTVTDILGMIAGSHKFCK